MDQEPSAGEVAQAQVTGRAPLALRSPVLFGVLMVGLMFGLKIVLVPVILLLPGQSTSKQVLDAGPVLVAVSFLVLPLETLIGQAGPIALLRRLKVRSAAVLVGVSACFFGLLHLGAGLQGFPIGLSTGIALSCCWLAWRRRSFLFAFVGTTLVHFFHNAVALPLAFAVKDL